MTSNTQNLTSDQSSHNKNHGLSLYTTKLTGMDNDCQVTNMWNVFKETITKSAVKHIPQKRTKVKDSRPWINTEIRKNLRKLQRLYKQKKKTGDQNTKEKYNQLQHHTQKITRQSYWKYIENIVTPKEEEPHSGMKKSGHT
jgi:hypothetical protein